MNASRFSLGNVSTAALILASVTLSGCSTHGSLSAANDPTSGSANAEQATAPSPQAANPGPTATAPSPQAANPGPTAAAPSAPPANPGPTAPSEQPAIAAQSATGTLAANAGVVGSRIGNVVTTAGDSIATTQLAGINNGVMTGLGGAVQQAGNTLDLLGQSTASSLGQVGQAEANILALQLASLPLVVEGVGSAISQTGNAVAAIDSGLLRALRPVANPAGALLNRTGSSIAGLSDNMTDAMTIPVVKKVTRGGSALIHMIAIDVETTTQNLGAATGLGVPVNNLLVGTGLTIQNVGEGISTTFATSPLIVSTGDIVSSTGTMVAGMGVMVTSPSSGNAAPLTSSLSTTAVLPTTITHVLSGVSSAPVVSQTTAVLPTTITHVLSGVSSAPVVSQTTAVLPTTITHVLSGVSSAPVVSQTTAAVPTTINALGSLKR